MASGGGGGVVRVDGDEHARIATIDPEIARVFISMMFGPDELSSGVSPHPAIEGGLTMLAGLCEKDPVGCLETRLASEIGLAWKGILAARKYSVNTAAELEEAKRDVVRLRRVYDKESIYVEDKQKLREAVTPLLKEIPSRADTISECRRTRELLGKMVGAAEKIILEEDAARLALKREVERQNDLDRFRSGNALMRSKIRKAQFPYWRFTIAYDKAMECMPTALSAEEEYCIEKNKYKMGEKLLGYAESHPKKTVCTEWVEKCEQPQSSLRNYFKPTNEKCRKECVSAREEGYDTSEEEAISEAVKYCSRECR